MSTFGSAIVLYSEYEAYKSNWRYMMEQHNLRYEAAQRWIRENSIAIDMAIYTLLLLWLGSWLLRCYWSCCAMNAVPPVDKRKLRDELAHVEHAIKALKDHKNCIIEKLKRD